MKVESENIDTKYLSKWHSYFCSIHNPAILKLLKFLSSLRQKNASANKYTSTVSRIKKTASDRLSVLT